MSTTTEGEKAKTDHESARLENLRVETDGNLVVITIDRPTVLNALNQATMSELDGTLDAIAVNEDVRAVIITGGGEKSFVAGADITEFNGFTPDGARSYATYGHSVLDKISHLRAPVIAAVNGFALGGGLELALACDFILASDNARLGLVETNLGIIPGFGGCARLSRRVGKAMAAEMIFSAAQVKADEALRIGLVNHVYPQAELLAEAKKLAGTIAQKGPMAVAAVKRLLREGETADLRVANSLEQTAFGLVFASQDKDVGVSAFLKKEKPAFPGR